MKGWFNNDQYFELDGKVFALTPGCRTIEIGSYDEVIENLNKIAEEEKDGKRADIQLGGQEAPTGNSGASDSKATKVRKEQHTPIRGNGSSSSNERQVRKIKEHVPKQYQRY